MSSAQEVTANDIAAAAAHAAFGRCLVTNVHRGLIAKAIVSRALPSDWRWCSANYSAWDFERNDGKRLEVKQAASRQSWHNSSDVASRISFDVRERTGRWEGADWFAEVRRWADLYVFAHHYDITEAANHRDPQQWRFYVVAEQLLPPQKSISISKVQRIAHSCSFDQLADEVERISTDCGSLS